MRIHCHAKSEHDGAGGAHAGQGAHPPTTSTLSRNFLAARTLARKSKAGLLGSNSSPASSPGATLSRTAGAGAGDGDGDADNTEPGVMDDGRRLSLADIQLSNKEYTA